MKTRQNLIKIPVLIALFLQAHLCGAQPVVTNIAAGLYHSLFIMSDGSLWGMGENGFGQLGIGNFNNTNLPVKIVTNDVVAIAGGGFHTLFVKSDGSLWAMGDNQYGELGDGTLNTTNLPEMILPGNVVAAAAGVYHSLILKRDSSLWGMGYNHDGQWVTALSVLQTRPIVPNTLPPMSSRSPPEIITACFKKATAVSGAWVTTPRALWAPAMTTAFIHLLKLPTMFLVLPLQGTTVCFFMTTPIIPICGPWVIILMASLAMAIITIAASPSHLLRLA